MSDPPGAYAPPPDDLLGANRASDESLNTQTRETVTGGTANPPAWSTEATQARLDCEKVMQNTFRVLGIVPSGKSTRRLMVLMHDASTRPLLESVGVLKERIRRMHLLKVPAFFGVLVNRVPH
ncbi:BQ5605_C030g10829 [Microbotryum silenes-dioicae]|uniref:BQ5605_C030g10829 protein n=1 Tax=Microbotryum silenes-dioicae TaxID=796604 RepID=A0A2X0MI76_9BASI|nr:BQ5605_C030g10829 [Microbotryum silenes-dioicae]